LISQLKPEPRTDIIKLLAQKQKLPTALIDLSDGLASDILYSLPISSLHVFSYSKRPGTSAGKSGEYQQQKFKSQNIDVIIGLEKHTFYAENIGTKKRLS